MNEKVHTALQPKLLSSKTNLMSDGELSLMMQSQPQPLISIEEQFDDNELKK